VNLGRAVQFATLLWPVAEFVLVASTRRKADRGTVRDRGSLGLMWGAIAAGLLGGIALAPVRAARIPLPAPWLIGAALVFLLGGLAIRGTAIITLGRFFTAKVSILEGHRLVRTGVFGIVRHPSYTGLLLAFLGLALTFGSYLSLAVILLPIAASVLYRIRVEESFLEERFGEEYGRYRRTTWCLVPGLY